MKRLLYFSSKTCGPCRMLAPKMEELAKEIPVEKIDVDEDSETAAKYDIQSIPTVIVVVDGEEKQRFVGAQNPKVYLDTFNKY
jgi:thioredoxin 1